MQAITIQKATKVRSELRLQLVAYGQAVGCHEQKANTQLAHATCDCSEQHCDSQALCPALESACLHSRA